jgi:hypothetical protein
MRIKLISKESHEKLLDIQKNFPNLTYEQKGYDVIDRSKFSEIEKDKDAEVNAILKKAVVGFSEFQNFNVRKNGDIVIRLQYNYGAEDDTRPFTGVGYVTVRELHEGFDNPGTIIITD